MGMSCAADMNCDTEASPPKKLILDRTLILYIRRYWESDQHQKSGRLMMSFENHE